MFHKNKGKVNSRQNCNRLICVLNFSFYKVSSKFWFIVKNLDDLLLIGLPLFLRLLWIFDIVSTMLIHGMFCKYLRKALDVRFVNSF